MDTDLHTFSLQLDENNPDHQQTSSTFSGGMRVYFTIAVEDVTIFSGDILIGYTVGEYVENECVVTMTDTNGYGTLVSEDHIAFEFPING